MTRRPLIWIVSIGVTLGAVLFVSWRSTGEPGAGWHVTIDGPRTEEIASKHLVVTGAARRPDGFDVPDRVTVAVVPEGLPPACGPEIAGEGPVRNGRYVVEVDLRCNGPYEISVVAHAGPATSEDHATADIGVAERPAKPPRFDLAETADGGLEVTWEPTSDLDTAGSILNVDGREVPFAPGVTRATLPPADRCGLLALRALRWGAGGPGTTIGSAYSDQVAFGYSRSDPPDCVAPSGP